MSNRFYMSGTDQTGEYVVVAADEDARVGYRPIEDNRYRVRIEPGTQWGLDQLAKVFTRDAGFTQPGDDGQPRFSRVLTAETANQAIRDAMGAVGLNPNNPDIGGNWEIEVNTDDGDTPDTPGTPSVLASYMD